MKGPKIPELLEKVNLIANNTDFAKLSKLEYDLLLQHLRDLYEAIAAARNAEAEAIVTTPQPVRKKLLNPNEGILLTTEVTPPVAEVKTEQPVVQKTIEPTPVVTEVKQQPPVTQPLVENAIKPEPVVPVTPAKTEPVVTKVTTPVTSINEKIQGSTGLNDKLKAGANEIHRRLAVKPLKDLIDLNKRFVIQNELFKGNTELMATAIQYIDAAPDITAAETYLNNEVAAKQGWDEASQAVRMFRKLVKQKFGEE